MELLKMGLLLLVGFLFGGYHFDDQVLISERLSGHHRVKLKNTRVLKVFLSLRDKNQRSYFSTVAVCLQIYAYLLGIANFLLAAVIRTREAVDIVLYILCYILTMVLDYWACSQLCSLVPFIA